VNDGSVGCGVGPARPFARGIPVGNTPGVLDGATE